MGRKKKEQDVDVASAVDLTDVVLHLDRDPNDPRNQAPTPSLPSLDDEVEA